MATVGAIPVIATSAVGVVEFTSSWQDANASGLGEGIPACGWLPYGCRKSARR